MKKFLLLSVLGFSALVSSAHPCMPENPVSTGPGKGKTDNPSYTGTRDQDRGLWLLTASITESRTMQKDTLISFMAGDKQWDKERHVTVRTFTSGEITAVIENQAEDPASEFWFHTDSGEPVSIKVTGQGSHTESSRYNETIDGKLISANIRDINVSGSPYPGASLMFYYTPDSKSASVGITINASGTDKGRMFYDEWKDYGSDRDNYSLSCSAGCDVSSDNGCRIIKTSAGYQANWRKSESSQRHTVDGTEFITTESSLSLTIKPYKEPDKPEVTLYGCSELSMEEQGEIMASGKPEGGKFRFWVEPDAILNVESDGESSAILTGATPGKGTLYVEYTTPMGKTNTTSQQASCVKIENYNGGQSIPQIALFDVDGKKLPGVLKIPLSAQPSNIEELVDFVPADKSVLAAVGLPGAVELTGAKAGKTSLNAVTNCGHETGPTVEVEVVNCSDETKAKLAEEMRIAEEARKQAYEEIGRILGSEDFAKAADRIAESTGNLAIKLGGAIIGSLSGGKATAGVNTAAKIYGVGSNLYDFVNSLAAGENLATASNLAQMIVELGGTENQQAVAGAIETIQAAHEFGKDLGQLIATDRKLQEAAKWAEHWNKYVEDVVRRQRLCRDSQKPPQAAEQPPKEPVSPKPDPEKPAPPTEKPKPKTEDPSTGKPPVANPAGNDPAGGNPAGGETAGDKPSGGETAGDDPGDTEVPPVPPVNEPRQIGLPYKPGEDCGCSRSREITGTSAGFSDLESGFANLGKCVEDFSTGPLSGYVNTLKGWKEVTDNLDNAVKAGPEELKKAAGEALPQIKLLLESTKSFDEAGKAFYENFKTCPESMASGVSFMRSAFVVTIDSLSTKY
jgi:hypothetical protein